MSDLTSFVLARIGEDEAVARALVEQTDRYVGCGLSRFRDDTFSLHEHDGVVTATPARVLAECESKRRIMEECADLASSEDVYTHADLILHALALPYAHHPDCREEWRP